MFNQDLDSGRIATSNDLMNTRLPYDGVSRLWFKSDPATSSVIDRTSAEYIVTSDEGIKYYHFFKHTLVGAEEHYFISLLGNWNRSRDYLKQLDAIPVFNTWSKGRLHASYKEPPRSKHEKTVHTSYLTLEEMDILRGLRSLGVFFARKFSTKMPSILDMIDKELLDE